MLLMKWLASIIHGVPYQWPSEQQTAVPEMLGYVISSNQFIIRGVAGLSEELELNCEGLTQDFVLLARTKGLSRRHSIYRHALRIALTPILPRLMFSFVGLLSGGAGITEQVYGIPGAGRLFIEATLEEHRITTSLCMILLSSVLLDYLHQF